MRIAVIQNNHFEGPAYIQEWASLNGHEMTYYKMYEDKKLPHIDDLDLLLILGGVSSVNDPLPYHLELQELVVDAQMNEKMILGICLGAQFLAKVFGAKVKQMPHKEIGFHQIEINNSDPFFEMFPEEYLVMHWHGEMFDLPKGAKSLASTIACANQIFRIGDKIFAFQCHPEMTKSSLIEMIQNCSVQLNEEQYVQTPEQILDTANQYCEDMNQVMGKFMDNLVNQSVAN